MSTFDAEVERVFKVHLQEELASRFYAFLGDERFSFIDFVRNLEDEAFRRLARIFMLFVASMLPHYLPLPV